MCIYFLVRFCYWSLSLTNVLSQILGSGLYLQLAWANAIIPISWVLGYNGHVSNQTNRKSYHRQPFGQPSADDDDILIFKGTF